MDKRLIIIEYNVTCDIFLMWCDIVLKLYLVEHASPRETLLRAGVGVGRR